MGSCLACDPFLGLFPRGFFAFPILQIFFEANLSFEGCERFHQVSLCLLEQLMPWQFDVLINTFQILTPTGAPPKFCTKRIWARGALVKDGR